MPNFHQFLKKNSIKEMKVKYIHTSLKIIILQICCDIYFKVMWLIICIVWLMLLKKMVFEY